MGTVPPPAVGAGEVARETFVEPTVGASVGVGCTRPGVPVWGIGV